MAELPKVTFCMIVFNGDYVLKQVLESVYPYAHKIVIVDGVVKYFADKGFTGSVDNTISIIKNFPDPEGKIVLHEKVVCSEKTELCQKFMESVPTDTEFVWCLDSDEVFKGDEILKVFSVLKERSPYSVSFRSTTFFGGFDHYLTGFENQVGFKRILKYEAGCTYTQHRPPTLSCERADGLHIGSDEMADVYGVNMYHYSYVYAKQVRDKVAYYKEAVSKDNCIDGYFENIWMKWVTGSAEAKSIIETEWRGVHEFRPAYRGDCFTAPFIGNHPDPILRDYAKLENRRLKQLTEALK